MRRSYFFTLSWIVECNGEIPPALGDIPEMHSLFNKLIARTTQRRMDHSQPRRPPSEYDEATKTQLIELQYSPRSANQLNVWWWLDVQLHASSYLYIHSHICWHSLKRYWWALRRAKPVCRGVLHLARFAFFVLYCKSISFFWCVFIFWRFPHNFAVNNSLFS